MQVNFGPNLEAETEVKVQFSGEELYGKVSWSAGEVVRWLTLWPRAHGRGGVVPRPANAMRGKVKVPYIRARIIVVAETAIIVALSRSVD